MELQTLVTVKENMTVCNAQKYTTGQEMQSKCNLVSILNATCIKSNNEKSNDNTDMSSMNNTSVTKVRHSSPTKRRSHKAVAERWKYKHNGRNSVVTNCNSPVSSSTKTGGVNNGHISFTQSPKNRIPCLNRARFQNNNRRHKIRRKYQNLVQNPNDRSPSSATLDKQQCLTEEDINNMAFMEQHSADTSKDETLVCGEDSKSHTVKCSATELLQNLVAEVGLTSPNSSASKTKKSSSTTSLNQITSSDGSALPMGAALSLPSAATAVNCKLDPTELSNISSTRNKKEDCNKYKEFSALFHLEVEDTKTKIDRNGNDQNSKITAANTKTSSFNGNSPIIETEETKFGRMKPSTKRKNFTSSQGPIPNLQYQNAISLICESMSPYQNQQRLLASQQIFDPTLLQKHILNQQILQYQSLQQKLILYNQQLSLEQKLINSGNGRQKENNQTPNGRRRFEGRQPFGYNSKMPLQPSFLPFNTQAGPSRSNFRWNGGIKRGNFNSPHKMVNNKNGEKNLNSADNERQTPSVLQTEPACKVYPNKREIESPQPFAVESNDSKKKTVTFDENKTDTDNQAGKQSKNLPSDGNKLKNPYKKCRNGNEITADANNNKNNRNIKNNFKTQSEKTISEKEREENQDKNERPLQASNDRVSSSLARSKPIKNLRTLKYVGTTDQVHNFWPKNSELITCEQSRYIKHHNDNNNNNNNNNNNKQNYEQIHDSSQFNNNVQNDYNFNEIHSNYHNQNKNEDLQSCSLSSKGSIHDLQPEHNLARKSGGFPQSQGKNYLNQRYHLMRSVNQRNMTPTVPADRFLERYHVFEIMDPPANCRTDPLSRSIWEIFMARQQSRLTFENKMLVWKDLYLLIKRSYPHYGLYLVGSTLTGFGMDSSDIDLCLVWRNMKSNDFRGDALTHLSNITKILDDNCVFNEARLIRAKVPILRFIHEKAFIEVDINFNNFVSIKNTHLLFCYSKLEWRVRPLGLIVKLWAKLNNINNAKERTISSYSLALMVIHFLQNGVEPPVIPRLHEKYPDTFKLMSSPEDFGYVDPLAFIGGHTSENNQTLGELFIGFLKYYATFNYANYAISVRTKTLTVEECVTRTHPQNNPAEWQELCVEEPFNLTNAARSCYDKYTFECVRHIFYVSWQNLERYHDVNVVLPTSVHR